MRDSRIERIVSEAVAKAVAEWRQQVAPLSEALEASAARNRVLARPDVQRIVRRLDIQLPPAGETLPIIKVDKALAAANIREPEERIRIKCVLARAGIIA